MLFCTLLFIFFFFFFFNDTATTEIYTLSLHDALPIRPRPWWWWSPRPSAPRRPDRKSTRLNSSHDQISYAVFCLKKKKKKYNVRLIKKKKNKKQRIKRKENKK